MEAKIYQDPITKLDFEGTAELIKQIPDDEHGFMLAGFERWEVKFPNDDGIYERTVDIEDKQE